MNHGHSDDSTRLEKMNRNEKTGAALEMIQKDACFIIIWNRYRFFCLKSKKHPEII